MGDDDDCTTTEREKGEGVCGFLPFHSPLGVCAVCGVLTVQMKWLHERISFHFARAGIRYGNCSESGGREEEFGMHGKTDTG